MKQVTLGDLGSAPPSLSGNPPLTWREKVVFFAYMGHFEACRCSLFQSLQKALQMQAEHAGQGLKGTKMVDFIMVSAEGLTTDPPWIQRLHLNSKLNLNHVIRKKKTKETRKFKKLLISMGESAQV